MRTSWARYTSTEAFIRRPRTPSPASIRPARRSNLVKVESALVMRPLAPSAVVVYEHDARSGTFEWPGKQTRACMYVYDDNGDLKSTNIVELTAGENHISVASGELVIAELVPYPGTGNQGANAYDRQR